MAGKRQRLADRPAFILDAADAVLRQGGARALTIDAVAAAAKLSKGGVLHHFASKDALVLALVVRKLEGLRAGIETCEAALPEGPDRLPRAMLAHARESYAADDAFSRALLLASIENPEALDGYRAFMAERLRALSEADGGRGEGAVLFFAVLGLMMGRTLGFHELGAAETAPMFGAMERVVAGGAPAHERPGERS
ncbi:TetR/AcrR family transcriptional regulator [Methylobacterium sp. NEAU 140]|uniref:TetR/AcrR family transcriptional regulator n=1 Tax=Methylobacterium sp. NEAU 140 TaxID=3064945 RepID=UPI002735965C|nr:TetR/AcrR family transcriptional regulator [Methylobacterium sp. NEAU 140]MDP4025279.1 TetR/AcrR family transcriptional regulator [Methylobacterium sp. NEAU 140]